MPFTLSHAAAVLPLHRLRRFEKLPLTAMILGSMLPDFGFLFGIADRDVTHSFSGLLIFCLPTGWLMQLLFWHVLRLPLLNLAPRALERRLLAQLASETRSFIPVSCALLLGALTHVVWDGFTHWSGFAATMIPALHHIVAVLNGRPIPLCDVLQHCSSVFGLLVLAHSWHRWASRTTTAEDRAAYQRLLWRATLVCVPLMTALISIVVALPSALIDRVLARSAALGLISAACCLLVYAVSWHVRQGRQGRRHPSSNHSPIRTFIRNKELS